MRDRFNLCSRLCARWPHPTFVVMKDKLVPNKLINPLHDELRWGIIKIHLRSLSFQDITINYIRFRTISRAVLLSQCHGFWWPGDERSQGISNHDIEPVLQKYFVLNPRRVNITSCNKLDPYQWPFGKSRVAMLSEGKLQICAILLKHISYAYCLGSFNISSPYALICI